MGRTGVAVDAAMFAALVGVDRAVEAHVGAGVAGDDRARPLGAEGGADLRRRRVLISPAVIENLALVRLVPARPVRARPPSSRLRHRHRLTVEQVLEQSKNKWAFGLFLKSLPSCFFSARFSPDTVRTSSSTARWISFFVSPGSSTVISMPSFVSAKSMLGIGAKTSRRSSPRPNSEKARSISRWRGAKNCVAWCENDRMVEGSSGATGGLRSVDMTSAVLEV